MRAEAGPCKDCDAATSAQKLDGRSDPPQHFQRAEGVREAEAGSGFWDPPSRCPDWAPSPHRPSPAGGSCLPTVARAPLLREGLLVLHSQGSFPPWETFPLTPHPPGTAVFRGAVFLCPAPHRQVLSESGTFQSGASVQNLKGNRWAWAGTQSSCALREWRAGCRQAAGWAQSGHASFDLE